jgi:patatin-like phospholipase/acyl hydrolase
MDGGGVRGVLTARILSRIVERVPDFLTKVDLFAGTSTGSLLTIGLAKGLSPDEIVTLYRERSSEIFPTSLWHNIEYLWGVAGAIYRTRNRHDAIYPSIGDVTLNDLLPRHVLVATFDLDSHNEPHYVADAVPRTWKAKFFHNFAGSDSDGDQKAIDVIMRSSAAPVYFPIYQGYIDGGVVANNPSMCALAQAINAPTGHQNLHDIVLLSIGTGIRLEYIPSQDGDWGLAQWGLKLLDLLFDAGSGLADYQCSQLLDQCYWRTNPYLHTNIGLDAVDQIDNLIAIADGQPVEGAPIFDIDPTLDWIRRRW